jgi:hypothetical protein
MPQQTVASPIPAAVDRVGDAVEACKDAVQRMEEALAHLSEAVAYGSRPPEPAPWPPAEHCVYEIEVNACGHCGAVRILPPGATPGHGEFIWACGWRDRPDRPNRTVELTTIIGQVPKLPYFVGIGAKLLEMGRTHVFSFRSKAGGQREYVREHEIRPWVEAYRKRRGEAA